MSFIEHFENSMKIINKHIELTKKEGIIIISIPNIKDSLYFTFYKIFGKERELLETHNLSIMDKGRLKELLQSEEVQILMLDYFGPINLASALNPKNKAMLILMHIVNQVLGYLTFNLKSKYFSPAIVLVAKKV